MRAGPWDPWYLEECRLDKPETDDRVDGHGDEPAAADHES
jgi:hypothetical protein